MGVTCLSRQSNKATFSAPPIKQIYLAKLGNLKNEREESTRGLLSPVHIWDFVRQETQHHSMIKILFL